MRVYAARLSKYVFVTTALLLLAQLSAIPARGQTQITRCGTTIRAAGNYVLANDLQCGHQDAITIRAGAVVLNLDSHTITGPGQDHDGIKVLGTGEVEVSNGTIRGFGGGVDIVSSSGLVQVSHVQTSDCLVGFFSYVETRIRLNLDIATHNTGPGFEVESDDSEIINNTAQENQSTGFYILGARNRISQNSARGNAANGIETADTAIDNQISNNTARDNLEFDLFDQHGTCRNFWVDNTFQTANLPCIH